MHNGGDEIGELAQRFLCEADARGLELINAQIASATGLSDWDEMNKWHRVRLRLMRMQNERATAARLGA